MGKKQEAEALVNEAVDRATGRSRTKLRRTIKSLTEKLTAGQLEQLSAVIGAALEAGAEVYKVDLRKKFDDFLS